MKQLALPLLILLMSFDAFSGGLQQKIEQGKKQIFTKYNLKLETFGNIPAEKLSDYIETFLQTAQEHTLPVSPQLITLTIYNDRGYRDILPHDSNNWDGGVCLTDEDEIRVSAVAPKNTVHYLNDMYDLRNPQENINLWTESHRVGPFTLSRMSWGSGCGGMPSDKRFLTFIENLNQILLKNKDIVANCSNLHESNVKIIVNNSIYLHSGSNGRYQDDWIAFSNRRIQPIFKKIINFYCNADY